MPEGRSSENDILLFICAQTIKKKKQKTTPCYSRHLSTAPNLTGEGLDSGLPHENAGMESPVQGNASKEETDSPLSNSGIAVQTERRFQRGELSNGPVSKTSPEQL